MRDWRRINVSFTRARSKLIIFGSRKTLKTAPLLQEFFELMESRDWILRLPEKAHLLHQTLRSQGIKRASSDAEHSHEDSDDGREPKRARRGEVSEESILKSRLILKDLMNESQ